MYTMLCPLPDSSRPRRWLAAQVLDTADEQSTLPTEFVVDRTLRTACQLDDVVDGDALIAALQKQVCCDFLKLAVSNLSTRPFVRHSSSHPQRVKKNQCDPRPNSPVLTAFYATSSSDALN